MTDDATSFNTLGSHGRTINVVGRTAKRRRGMTVTKPPSRGFSPIFACTGIRVKSSGPADTHEVQLRFVSHLCHQGGYNNTAVIRIS